MLRRALQSTLLAAHVVLVSAWLVLGQGPNIQPVSREGLTSAVWIVLWWSFPALLLFFHQTWVGTLVTGIALLAASDLALLFIYSSNSSTSAIGFLTLPPVGLLIAMVLLAAEWLLRRPWYL
jgi:hypothetical protein